MARNDKKQRLERTVAHIQQQWGARALSTGRRFRPRISAIATGFPQLDQALGCGGIPRGKISLLSGHPTSGKTTLAALILARAQAHGRPVAYLDIGHTCDADYLQRCGVRLPDLLVVRPRTGRQAVDLALALAKRPELAAIVLDNWQALVAHKATQRYATAMLDHLTARLGRSGSAFIVLDDPPSLWQRLTGSPLHHACSLHLRLSRDRWLLQGPDVRGYEARVTIERNRLGPSGHSVPIAIRFNGTVRGAGI